LKIFKGNMKTFELYLPTRILFGDDCAIKFVTQLEQMGSRAVLVTGGGSVERLGYLDRLMGELGKSSLVVKHFSGIEPNPLARTIDKIAEEAAKHQPDFVIALGGGSVMDASKAIAFLLASKEKNIWPFVAGEPRAGQVTSALPLACIPTTAATASEVTPYAVISNAETKGKAPIAHECLKPAISWINPAFTTNLPDVTTRDGAADILSHVFENYLLGGDGASLTDRYCESVMRTVMETLPRVIQNPDDLALRGTMLWCSTLALNGMQTSGRDSAPFILHSMEHALSGVRHDLAHGRGLATLYPSYFKWLLSQGRAEARMAQLAQRLFDSEPSAEWFTLKFNEWLRENELFQSLYDLGFEKGDFPGVAAEVMRIDGGEDRVLDVLGPMTEQDIIEIFEGTASQH